MWSARVHIYAVFPAVADRSPPGIKQGKRENNTVDPKKEQIDPDQITHGEKWGKEIKDHHNAKDQSDDVNKQGKLDITDIRHCHSLYWKWKKNLEWSYLNVRQDMYIWQCREMNFWSMH